MSAKLLQDTFKNAFEEFVDTRIGDILGPMRDDSNSNYSKHSAGSNKAWHEIFDILAPMGEEKRDLIFELEREQGGYISIAYDAIYRQAFLDGLNCKDINSIWKDAVNNEQKES